MPKATKTVIMSPPTYFDIEYSINPWMNLDNKVDRKKAIFEWNTLRDLYKSLGLSTKIIPAVPGLPDLVFTTDHGVFIQGTFYLSRFRYDVREKEQQVAIPWYNKNKIKTQEIPSVCYMEGGDVQVHDGYIFVGHGFRTSYNTIEYLQNTTGLTPIALELVDEAFYHLDTCFFPLSQDTAFYYPGAFGTESIKAIKSHFDLAIPISSHEAESFVCNSIVVGKNVICQECPTFEQKLLDLKYNPINVTMTEFNKSGGGIHCLSQIITT